MAEAQIIEKRRHASPAVTPQALGWDDKKNVLWMGSRDLRRIYAIDAESWAVVEEREAPGIPWAAVAINGEVRFTIGEGADDDRYVYRYTPEDGFSKMFACPEFTGSYLSEQPNENWRIARLDPQQETPKIEDIAVVPFACRSLTSDGELFWSNYRAKNRIISFALPS